MALPVLIFIAVVLLIIVGAVFSHQAAKKRRIALGELAHAQGWRFVPDKDHEHDELFRQFSMFQSGSSRYAYNSLYGQLLIGETEYPLKTGDFHYQTTSTDSKGKTTTHHHHFSYLLVDVPYPGVPELSIRPEGLFDKIGGFFGFDDIDFESAEFSKKFHVKSTDKRFAYDVIHPCMMEFLLATPGPKLSISGGHCCVTERGVWKPEEFSSYLEWVQMFFERWPRHVTADLESRA